MDVSSFLGGNFLSQVDLQQPVQLWTIGKVDQQLVGQGQTADQRVCVTFAEFPSKPLALNKTNLKRVAELYTVDANAWIGRQVQVYRTTTDFAGRTTLCVRVCGPTQAPPEPLCDQQGNAVPFQPQQVMATSPVDVSAQMPAQPVAVPTQQAPTVSAPPAAAQPTVQQSSAPWEQNENSPPSA